MFFTRGEALRVYDLLDGLGCMSNPACFFNDFTTTTECGYKSNGVSTLECDASGFLVNL
jgi:hypothetical protein